MQKQAPTLGRILVMAGFALSCFGLLLFLWLAFGGSIPLKPKGYRFTVPFKEAGQLAQEADVRISGVSVGKVKAIDPDSKTGSSNATIELQERYAPIPRNARAILRQKTLLGETYVELTPGDDSSGMLPENGHLPPGQVAPTVELDEIFRAFDAKTRAAFQTWLQQLALATQGRGRDISDAIGNLPPFVEDTTLLLKILDAQEASVRGVVRDTGAVFDALSARDDQLRSLIDNSNRVFATTAARNRELAATFRALPTFEDEARTTVARLTQFARTTNPLVTQLRPAARQLSPTLQQLSALAPDLDGLFTNLNPLIDASKRGLPALESFLDDLRPLLAEVDAPLRQLNPALQFIGNYKHELAPFFANAAAATQGTGESGGRQVHYLRTTNPANPEALAVYPRRLASNRPNPYQFPDAFKQLAQGLPSFETRQCSDQPSPTLGSDQSLIPAELESRVQEFYFGPLSSDGQVAAPPCRQQPPYRQSGDTTLYPHVKASSGAVARGG